MLALIRYSAFTFFSCFSSFMILNVIYFLNDFPPFRPHRNIQSFSGMWELMLRISISQGRLAEREKTEYRYKYQRDDCVRH